MLEETAQCSVSRGNNEKRKTFRTPITAPLKQTGWGSFVWVKKWLCCEIQSDLNTQRLESSSINARHVHDPKNGADDERARNFAFPGDASRVHPLGTSAKRGVAVLAKPVMGTSENTEKPQQASHDRLWRKTPRLRSVVQVVWVVMRHVGH